MSFSDEEIIAFLLGEAESKLVNRIQDRLRHDSDLVARVSHFRSLLNHLNGSGQCFEPPSGLVESTLQRMSALGLPGECQSDEHISEGESVTPSPVESVGRASRKNALGLSSGWALAPQNQGWLDSAALTISLICLSCLILPAILSVRFESRRLQCAENLRINGQALISFALRSPDQRLPAVSSSGPEAFAGIYAVRLYNVGLLKSRGQLRCVSLMGIERPTVMNLSYFPSAEQLNSASQKQLVHWQEVLGGDYAYNLGIMQRHRLVAPKSSGRTHFAILADAPVVVGNSNQLLAHDGRGVNILYDDGHVEFVSSKKIKSTSLRNSLIEDHPFCNRSGDRQAGLDDSDASLAPSAFPPLER